MLNECLLKKKRHDSQKVMYLLLFYMVHKVVCLCFVAIASSDCVEIFVTLINVYTFVIYEMRKNETYNLLVSKV